MKPYYEAYMSDMHRKRTQRRRIVSMLLVLSVFVTSGVSWALRGVGLTMVNEAECGWEEHIHTDDCYERQLICGLEEDASHTHTDACWADVLVCGCEEHIHDAQCYGGSSSGLFSAKKIALEDARSDAEGIAEYDDTEDFYEDADEEDSDADAASLRAAAPSGQLRAAGESTVPNTVETVDNIARGIKITLFDYGDSVLEGKDNNYGYARDDSFNVIVPYRHDNIKDSGINTGRYPENDIMFFAYGTPVEYNTTDGTYGNYVDGNGTRHYDPDKNNLSGDYDNGHFYSMNRPVQNIVNSTLRGSDGSAYDKNGYPSVAGSNHSLDYLFDESDGPYKTVYTDANHLLQLQNGHLVYDSDRYYAYFDQTTHDFEVYDGTYWITNKDHHLANTDDHYKTYENTENGHEKGDPVHYDNALKPFRIGFFPFDEYDAYRNDPNYDGAAYNHHFGMKMEAKFVNVPQRVIVDNEEKIFPVTFKYSGDDDMWVFVDGQLVLDIGGIHEPAGGMIDFTNGYVWTQDNEEGQTLADLKGAYPNIDFDNLPQPTIYGTSDGAAEPKWKFETIASRFAKNGAVWDDTPGAQHEIKMFYLERGGCYSNLAMEMNLPTVKPLDIVKEVDYKHHYVNNLYDDAEYWFQVFEKGADGEWHATQSNNSAGAYYLPEDDPALQSSEYKFKLKDGQRKTFDTVEQHREFKVVELGVDPNIYDKVLINGVDTAIVNGEVASEGNVIENLNCYTFTNSIAEELVDVRAKKNWEPPNKKIDGFNVKYRILRTDSVTGETKQVAVQKLDETTGQWYKKRVFTVPASKWEEGVTEENLLARYGDHYYTYRIEELNAPDGFKAAYSYTKTEEDGKNVLIGQITNTDVTKTEINAEKRWERMPPGDHKVQLRLTRKKVGYQPSTPTRLQVIIEDEGGNLIRTYTTPAYVPESEQPEGYVYEGVYANGSAELAYAIPEGAVLYWDDEEYPQKELLDSSGALPIRTEGNNSENGTLYIKFEEDEKILCVYNLAPPDENNPDAIPNVVRFKLKTDKAKDELLLLHHSFTRGTNGWMTNTTSEYVTDTSGNIVMEGDGVTPKLKVTSSSINAYAKGDGLIVQGRTNAWNGAKLPLDPAIFKPNRTYSFTVYVWSPVDDDFKLTFNDGLGGNEPLQVLNSGERSVHVQAETWTPITGTIQLTKQIDPYNMYLLIETLPVNGNYQTSILPNGGDYFRIDEFIAVEGNTPVTVDQGSGKVYVGEVQSQTQTGTAYNFQFSNGMEGWHVQDFDDGNSGTQVKSEGNNFPGIQVYGRDQHNDGIAINVPKLIPGNTYQFSGRVQEDGPNPNNGSPVAQVLQLTLNTGTGQYPAILKDFNMNTDSSNNYQYRDFSVSFQIPADADPSTMSIYFETPEPRNGANPDLGSFRVHYLTITGEYATGSGTSVELDDVPGYDETTGQYVSDYSNYNMILDVDSVTKPLRLLDTEYKTDYVSENVEWERVVTLPDEGDPADPWKYHWDNQNPADTDHYLDEVHTDTEKYLYIYHLEETWIDSEGNVINTIVKEGEADKFISNDENYLVTYTDNDVATNTPGSPILVTNRYIWYKLPATGGAGADVFYGTGLLLTLTGFIGGYALRKRERRFK